MGIVPPLVSGLSLIGRVMKTKNIVRNKTYKERRRKKRFHTYNSLRKSLEFSNMRKCFVNVSSEMGPSKVPLLSTGRAQISN
jgi:hypothetical protein